MKVAFAASIMLLALGVSATGTTFTFYEDKDTKGDQVGPEDYEPDGQDKDVCLSHDDGINSVKFDARYETWEAAKAAVTVGAEAAVDGLLEDAPKYCIWGYKEEHCDSCVEFAYTYDYSDDGDDHRNFEDFGVDGDDIKSVKVTVGGCPSDDYDQCGIL